VLAALLFRDPIEQRLAGGQPPTISETAVILTSEALAAALIAATASATETAVPTQTAIVTPSVSATQPATATHTPTPPATDTPTSIPTSTPAQPGDLVIRETDGMPMSYVPGGAFLMGSPDEDITAAPDEKPQHEVTLDPFFMDQYEVSVAQYAAFLNRLGSYKNACLEKDCVHPRFEAGFTSYLLEEDQGNGKLLYIPLTGFANFPINHVSWYGAQAYCQAMGGRLPTEAEWEYAARGSDGRIYPWGNQAPNENLAVFNSDSYEKLKPVNALPAGSSPFNILGMAGSMWEWTNDWYDEDYYSISPDANPTGPETGLMKAIRGGAWPNNNLADRVRAANRSNFTPDFISATVGFRCVQDP
ncbi:MAG: SUMF1/EgtB/PvdO family nonheme iron enzyme, partial [Chloroflexota bacterium]